MNKLALQRQRNNVARLIRQSNRNKNVLRWSINETDAHIQAKLDVCKFLKKLGHEFYTEAIFADGSGRADVIDADAGIIIEVLESESKESIDKKIKKYALPLLTVDAHSKTSVNDLELVYRAQYRNI